MPGVEGSLLPKSHSENKAIVTARLLIQIDLLCIPQTLAPGWPGPNVCPRKGKKEWCGDRVLTAEGGKQALQYQLTSVPRTHRPFKYVPGVVREHKTWLLLSRKLAGNRHVIRVGMGSAGCCFHWFTSPQVPLG